MLMRFDPFRDLDRLSQLATGGGIPNGRSAMPMDAYRDGDHFVVNFDLPGVDPDSIDLTVEKNALTVSAERSWTPGEGVEVQASERLHGRFLRQLLLGDGLDDSAIDATYDRGVLTLTIPVAEQAKPRRISVSARDQAAIDVAS